MPTVKERSKTTPLVIGRQEQKIDLVEMLKPYETMLLRHEERIQDIESGMDNLTSVVKDTNHHLSNMRTSLKMLKPITESVQEIEKSVELNVETIRNHEQAFALQKVQHDESLKYIKERVDSIGPWVKWGVSVLFLFVSSMAALKLFT